jgi:hypothetical protein
MRRDRILILFAILASARALDCGQVVTSPGGGGGASARGGSGGAAANAATDACAPACCDPEIKNTVQLSDCCPVLPPEPIRQSQPTGCYYFVQQRYDEAQNCLGQVRIIGCECRTGLVDYLTSCYVRSSSDGGREVWLSDVNDPLEGLLFAQGFVRCESAPGFDPFHAPQCADGG